MTLLKRILKSSVLYPILFAIFPVMSLWANNFGQVLPIWVLRPLIFSLLGSILLYLFLWFVLRNPIKAALLSTLIILLYFTYGHVYGLLLGLVIGRHRYLILLWLLLLGAGTFLILRYGSGWAGLNQFLNVVGIALFVLSAIQLTYLQVRSNIAAASRQVSQNNQGSYKPAKKVDLGNAPDVYLIVLDAYMRDDILRRDYNFDNSGFIKQLNDLGFVIPACAQSNYAYTILSMGTILNMNYLDVLDSAVKARGPVDYKLYGELIHHSLVRKNFKELGYQFITFKNTYPWVDITDADVYIPETNKKFYTDLIDPNDYDEMLNKTTAWRMTDEIQTISPFLADQLFNMQYYFRHYLLGFLKDVRSRDEIRHDIIISDLDKIDGVTKMPGKKFVYLHVPAPHPPFVLGVNGEFAPTADPIKGYDNSVTYLNSRVIPIIKTILANSKNPPVIILQGDHGWGITDKTRTFILNAYHLPGEGASQIYPTITPVNTFRLIFNTYFGGNYPLLDDKSYFSPDGDYFNLQAVPTSCSK